MPSYDERRDHETRLRKIVLNSPDVLPDEVREYLREIAGRHAHWGAKKQVLKEYRRLVDHLTKEYVDFVLGYLVPEPKGPPDPTHPSYPRYLDRKYENLGLEHDLDFFPPSYVQGPFLLVLRKDEDEGLRLVHTLANTAVAKWREREEDSGHLGYSQRPLPVHIELPNGRREFWGNGQVYYWYRPMSNGPHAVISALMALEVWMEERIEAGADAEELFEKVLSGSDCVAVLGLCLGIALAYPGKCLRAALPLVCSPDVWTMEIPRFTADMQGSFKFDPLGTHRAIYRLEEERDARPQRSLEVRNLAPYYALSDDEALRAPFEQAVGRFTENLPFRYQEERENPETIAALRERMENLQVYANPDNYRVRQTDEGIQIWVEPPEHIRKRNAEAMAPITESLRWSTVQMWTQKTIEKGESSEEMTPDEAVAAAKEFQRPQDFSSPSSPDLDDTRLQAIAGVAAAVLVIDFGWVQERGLTGWCKEVLLDAAAGPGQEYAFDSAQTRYPADTKVSAALGLGTLVAHGSDDSEVREQLIKLTGDPHYQVVEAVLRGLKGAWNVDNALCWNVFSLALSLCMLPGQFRNQDADGALRSPREAEWAERLVDTHLQKLSKNKSSSLPRIPTEEADSVFLWDLAGRILGQLPLPELAGNLKAKAELLRLTDGLMAWTVAKNMPEDPYGYRSRTSFEWNFFFFEWAARLARSLTLEEARTHVLSPVKECWSQAPGLTADLLYGYLSQHVAYVGPLSNESETAWREICDWVLGSREVAEGAPRIGYIGDATHAFTLVVFVRHGSCLLEDHWSHAKLFADVIDRWVRALAHNPHAYKSLLVMLEGPGWKLTPQPALGWLNRAVTASSDVDRLWGEGNNGERTAELLQRIWKEHRGDIMNDAASLQVYSDLVDRLVFTGVPLASLLQQNLQERHHSR